VLSRSHVELRAVQWTRDRVVAQSPVRQTRIAMRTVVVEGEQLTFHSTHHHTVGSDAVDASHGTFGKIGEVARP
jgi:hypothetical protein